MQFDLLYILLGAETLIIFVIISGFVFFKKQRDKKTKDTHIPNNTLTDIQNTLDKKTLQSDKDTFLINNKNEILHMINIQTTKTIELACSIDILNGVVQKLNSFYLKNNELKKYLANAKMEDRNQRELEKTIILLEENNIDLKVFIEIMEKEIGIFSDKFISWQSEIKETLNKLNPLEKPLLINNKYAYFRY